MWYKICTTYDFVHMGFDTLYAKSSLVCCSIIMLLDLSYLYKIFFERSKPRKIRHEFLNQKILNFWRGVGGGGGRESLLEFSSIVPPFLDVLLYNIS